LRCPSECSIALLAAERCRLAASSRNWLLVQSFGPVSGIAGIGFAIPVCRSTCSPAVRFFRDGWCRTRKRPVRPLVEFGLPPESCPTQPSLPTAVGGRLSWAFAPFSTSGIGGPLVTGLTLARYVPPTGFGYPHGGLRPPSPCRFCFTPAALVGFTLRSFLLTQGAGCVSASDGPAYRFSRRCSRRRSIGPARRAAVSGIWPLRESLADVRELTRRRLAAPMGLALLGYSGSDLARDFARTPPARFAPSAFRPPPRAPRSFDQPSPDSARRPASRSDGQNSPFRVPAPARLRTLKRGFTLAMCSPCAASRVTANCPTRFG
jgi:hypothetical protein